jgi:hypothetical protein
MSERSTTPRIVGSATPRAIVTLTGIVGLRPGEDSCELTADGTVIWRLQRGLVVTLAFAEDGTTYWHLYRDDDQFS